MKTLIIYPHGLGDCILATPALREFKRETGDFVGFATLERFRTARLFENNPNVDEIVFTPDPWNDFRSFGVGCESVRNFCDRIARKKRYDRSIFVRHSPAGHKIADCAAALGVDLAGPRTEVYIGDSAWERAREVVRGLGPYGFVQTETGAPSKDLPSGYGRAWLRVEKGLRQAVEVGVTFPFDAFDINAQFAVMALADAVCLPDSVFYHACGAMGKPVDFAYFARGGGVHERVRPLHPVRERVAYRLDPIREEASR